LSGNLHSNTNITINDDSDSFLAQPDPTTINDPDRLLDYYGAEPQAKSPRRKTVPEILATGTILQEATQ
jgi:hypothetical protein